MSNKGVYITALATLGLLKTGRQITEIQYSELYKDKLHEYKNTNKRNTDIKIPHTGDKESLTDADSRTEC